MHWEICGKGIRNRNRIHIAPFPCEYSTGYSTVHSGNKNNWNLQRRNLYQKFCLWRASVLSTVSTVFIGFVEPEIYQLWCKVFDTFRRVNRSFDSKHLVLKFTTCAGFVDRESRYCSLLLFCVREINRFLEIPNRGSRKILRVSRNSNLDPRNSILETQASILDVRFSKTSRIEDRVSSRDCQLTFARYCMFQCTL